MPPDPQGPLEAVVHSTAIYHLTHPLSLSNTVFAPPWKKS